MSLTSALEIGKSGMRIYQVAAEVVSENIANVNTEGYSRQRVVLETAPPTTANGFPLGTGVRISTVERYYDALLQKQLVNAGTTLGYDSKKTEVLQQIEPIFNEIAQDGLGAALSDFFSSWQDLTSNPTGSTERQAVLAKGQILVDQFHYVSSTLTTAITQQDQSIPALTGDMNQMLTSIARLNSEIRNTELSSGNANEMRDQRDLLIRQLGEKIGVSFTENADGTTDVTTTIGATTYALVTGSQAGSFSQVVNGGTGLYDVQLTPVGGVATTVVPTTGKLGAVLTMRDTTIPGYRTQVNTLANQLVTSVNGAHSTGFALDGVTTGLNFFNPAGTTAATIALSGITSAQIAASGTAGQAGDNANALKLAQLANANTMSGGTTTFNNYYDGLVAQIGLDVQSSQTVLKQDEAFMKQLTTLRDSNSGVSLDEELTDLIKYQRSYQASAKLITTASDMLDIVIGMIR